jgi:mannitol/fructose-specific phosphotransferase system IIA component (Ntr-type)
LQTGVSFSARHAHGQAGDHLKTLARISRILKNPVLRDNLRHAAHRQELQRLICEEDSKYPQK